MLITTSWAREQLCVYCFQFRRGCICSFRMRVRAAIWDRVFARVIAADEVAG